MQNFDDLDIEGRNPSRLSEEEREKDDSDRKRLMRCSVTAEDGTLRPVYSRTDDGDIWCHICNIALFGSHKLQSHNTSSRHKIKLDEWPYPVSLWSKKDLKNSGHSISTINDSLAPGEPVPPGMEDQMDRGTQIQTSLDRHQSSPLVGLEYLLELVDNDSCEPSYTCVLCDKRGDPRTVMAHITSYNHRITYLNRHFPTISRAITDLPRTPNYKRGANEISVLVAKKIEEKFGRLHPQLVDKNQFEKSKLQFIKNVYQDYHFRETPELTFMDVYDVRWVTNFEEKMAEMSSDTKKDVPSEEIIDDKPKKEDNMEKAFPKKIEPDTSKTGMKIRILTKDKLIKKPEKDGKHGPEADTKSLSSLSSISSSPSPSRSRSKSPGQLRNREKPIKNRYNNKSFRYGRSRSRSRSLEPLRERDKWDKFREQIRRAEETLDRSLKFHEKNPEKHPAYPDEWKKFWNRRYKELQAEGKDPSKHDFKPEWIEFWNKRMREIHNEQLSHRKEEIRKRLELPEDKPPEPKWTAPKRDKEERNSPNKRVRHHIENSEDDDVEYVGTKTIKPDRGEYRERHETHMRERDYGAYVYREKPVYRNYYGPSVRPPMPRRHYQPYPVKEKPINSPKDDNLREDLEIVGLLRLLTALEGQLGSLGPKVVALLSKALGAEKAKPNSADDLLQDEEVSVLFETVKEKLKGQLFAGMIEKVAIAATKSAIQNIAKLLHKATEEKKRREEEAEKTKKQAQEIVKSIAAFSAKALFPTIKSEPVSVPGIGSVDKVAIAQQIAAALIAQGRNNVSQDELETLINAVVGMAEASQRSDTLVTAANFVKSLTSQGSILDSPRASTSTSISVTPTVIEPIFEKVKEISAALLKVDPIEAHAARMESLMDNDLKDLLQNFKELGTDEQHGLINFLKKLEATDPARVEKLRGYVNLGGSSSQRPETPVKEIEEIPIKTTRSVSPFTSRKGAHNPSDDDHARWKPKLDIFADDEDQDKKRKEDERNKKLELSDDDDDYTFEDIYKAADKNVLESEKARRSNSLSRSWSRSRSKSPLSTTDAKTNDPTAILNETKRLIANIMGDLPNKYVVKSHNPQKERQESLDIDLVPPGSTNVSIPSSNYPSNYPSSNQSNQMAYSGNMSSQNFSNYQQPQQQSYNHQGYMNNMSSNMSSMSGNMSSMPSNMSNMPSNMGNMPSNMNNMPSNMSSMSSNMSSMSSNMNRMSSNMNSMSSNMNSMSSNMNNIPSNIPNINPNIGSMSNINNGYSNYNPPSYNNNSSNNNNLSNQNQYSGPPMQQNQYPPQQQMYSGSQYGASSSAPIGYPPQNQYGNYSQQRFY